MRIEQCLDKTAKWCSIQMDALDRHADELQAQVKDSSADEVKKTVKQWQYLDESMGMLHEIRAWAKFAAKEIRAAARTDEKGRGVA